MLKNDYHVWTGTKAMVTNAKKRNTGFMNTFKKLMMEIWMSIRKDLTVL